MCMEAESLLFTAHIYIGLCDHVEIFVRDLSSICQERMRVKAKKGGSQSIGSQLSCVHEHVHTCLLQPLVTSFC